MHAQRTHDRTRIPASASAFTICHDHLAPDFRLVCSFLSGRARRKLRSPRHHDAARPDSVRRDFTPRPVSSHKGLPTDDVVPCLLRPICSSAISVAAIAREAFSLPIPLPISLFRVYVFQRARVLAMADGVHACVCVHLYKYIYIYIYVLSWLNSRSAGTNYNEPRLVGRESAMFSFLCPVVYRPFYRGHPPPSLVSPPSRPISCHIPRHLPRPLLYPLPLPNPSDDTSDATVLHTSSSTGFACNAKSACGGRKKNFSFLKPGQKKRLENLGEIRGNVLRAWLSVI